MSEARCGLVILDGAGIAPLGPGNVVNPDTMPYLFHLFEKYGMIPLEASGLAVGLPDGFTGNSEVGHLTIGLGRSHIGSIAKIDNAYRNGEWQKSKTWQSPCMKSTKDRPLHVLGMVSDAGVHAHWQTILQVTELAVRNGEHDIFVHLVLDGVDSAPGSAPELVQKLTLELARRVPDAKIGVIIGRKWFTDRSGNYELTDTLVNFLYNTDALPVFSTDILKNWCYSNSEQHFPAHIVRPNCAIHKQDRVIVTSHRADRAAQIVNLLSQNGPVFTMVTISKSVTEENVFFPTEPISGGLAEILKEHGLSIVRIAEKCKFPHVTYFFNGFQDTHGEQQICIPDTVGGPESDPNMRAFETAMACRNVMQAESHRAFLVNIPNLDQVGHTADIELCNKAATATDEALTSIISNAHDLGWHIIVSADHGNAEQLIDELSRPSGSHTTNSVPMTIIPPDGQIVKYAMPEGSLQNIAPTIADILGIEWDISNGAGSLVARSVPCES